MSDQPNIFVMVDMEGISGIFQSPQVLPDPGGSLYQAGRRYASN